MHFSKLFIIFSIFLLVQIINNLPLIHSKSLFSPYIFREYIGAEGKSITFSDIPINPNIEFHFILSFSIDYTDSNHSIPSNGEFNVYWDTQNLSPSHVLAIKAQHPNVKVAMSLGGDSTSGNTDVVFSPVSVDSWLSNAIRSITKIVQEYHLDGIDIDYEHFNNTGPDTFAECIGRLVSYLKENGIISFSSIAPFDSDTIQQHYTKLWSKYGHVIDYVNFQFYAYDESTNVDEFLDHFDDQTSIYYGGKILASFATDGSGGLSPRHGFFKACKILQSEGKLVGIFIWSADDSKKANFHYEMKSQHFLVHGNVQHIN